MLLENKTVLITGGSRRIGRALALGVADAGAKVALHTLGPPKRAANTAEELQERGVETALFVADFEERGAGERLYREVIEKFGRVDVIINNASLFGHAKLVDTSDEDLKSHLKINLIAPFVLARAMHRDQVEGSVGKVINIGDQLTVRTTRFAYGVSKWALRGLTASLAASMHPSVQVNQVDLGAVLPPADSGVKTPESANPKVRRVVETVLRLIAADNLSGQIVSVSDSLE